MRAHVIAISSAFALAAWGCGSANERAFGGPYSADGNPAQPSDPSQSTEGTEPSDTDDAGAQTADAASSAAKDAGTTPGDAGTTPRDSGTSPPPPPPPPAPTWSSIYAKYFASGTTGHCGSCHSQATTATKAYSWLKSNGYISGTTSALVDPSQSCLSWYGGSMPPNGPSTYAAAKTDLNAWVAAGAQNN